MDYVERVPQGDVLEILAEQPNKLTELFGGLSDKDADFRFAPGEWTIKEVIGHLTDAERTFSYRAFVFSRDETVSLPGVDPDLYVREGRYADWTLAELLDQLATLRRTNIIAFQHLPPEATRRSGVVSGASTSVRSLVYLLAGHVMYHIEDLTEKYLPALGR